MARGRELRAQGKYGSELRAIPFAETEAGKLVRPKHARSLHSASGHAEGDSDYKAGTVPSTGGLRVVYVPYATEETIGVSTTPTPQAYVVDASRHTGRPPDYQHSASSRQTLIASS
jgi:hypothetical protein